MDLLRGKDSWFEGEFGSFGLMYILYSKRTKRSGIERELEGLKRRTRTW